MKISKILFKAAERLETHGWCIGIMGEVSGPNCAAGAIRMVYSGKPHGDDGGALRFAAERCPGGQLTELNDLAASREEVQDFLIFAAVEAEELGK